MADVSVMINDVKFNYRVGLLIEKDDKILIECNPNLDFVVIPGGRVKTLENSIDALIRELKEEMGIIIKKSELKKKGLLENFFEFEDKKYHELFLVYKVKIKANDSRFKNVEKNLDSKDNYYQWVDIDKLNDINLLPVALKTLLKTKQFTIITVNS